MDLYVAPLACSMASRIALYEAGAADVVRVIQVDTHTKRVVADGSDFLAVNPLGQVPVLRLEDGTLLTENAAILQHLAARFPTAWPALPDVARDRLRQWLSFIGTELHATVFLPLLDPRAPEGARAHARAKAPARLGRLAAHLEGRETLVDGGFTVADAYLAVVLNWAPFAGVDLAQWPALAAWHARVLTRPSVARALAEERALYAEEQARRRAAA